MEAILEFSLGVYVVIGVIFFLFLKVILRFSSGVSFYFAAVLAILLLAFPWVILILGLICFFTVKKKKSKYMTLGLTSLLLSTGYVLTYEKDKIVDQESHELVDDRVRNVESLENEEKNDGQTSNEEEIPVDTPADVPTESTQSLENESKEDDNSTERVEDEKSEGTSVANEGAVTEEESPYHYEEVVYDDGSSYKGNFVNGLYHGYGMLFWGRRNDI
ncbi:hypothetical protein V7114_14970 [Neobacillus niacini]|uniref:hypothetical protein n=1 Tax=Neobacillus niacini TaxID=86668 RepID=UPI002FFDB83F